ncbi:MAG: hypothetical protein KAI16_02180 [Candidatus Pacebacteria bacterium]|nr:hypothetical protein [Candidatus Paceibacterota bacterium]
MEKQITPEFSQQSLKNPKLNKKELGSMFTELRKITQEKKREMKPWQQHNAAKIARDFKRKLSKTF